MTEQESKTVPLVVYIEGKRHVVGEATINVDGTISCQYTTDLGRELLHPGDEMKEFSIAPTMGVGMEEWWKGNPIPDDPNPPVRFKYDIGYKNADEA